MTDLDESALRDIFDRQMRPDVPDPVPAGGLVERDGPLVRVRGLAPRGFVTYRDLAGADVDALIRREVAHFTEVGEPVEWKLYGHDEPADLPERLRQAGFEPEEQETVLVGPVAALAATQPVLPDGVRLREMTALRDLERIAAMESTVWATDLGAKATALAREIEAGPDAITVVGAEAGDEVVSAAWIRYAKGTSFGTLWGGATLPGWRGKGIYRALVVYRAKLAAARGYTLLQVDASEDSRPILERMGFVAVATTTPYVFTPGGTGG
ncbi:GNAT family N-acetyltransferase [Actinomycetes bacterium KLBMP 9797]